jgi:hypothetical protein
MLKNVVRWIVLGLAVYGGAIVVSKTTQKMKLKKSGGNPADVKWLK